MTGMASRKKVVAGIALLTGMMFAVSRWRSSSEEMDETDSTLAESN
jgi:hypothetical protein